MISFFLHRTLQYAASELTLWILSSLLEFVHVFVCMECKYFIEFETSPDTRTQLEFQSIEREA
jgi:hypothetical protein